jgi:hypothetical protein
MDVPLTGASAGPIDLGPVDLGPVDLGTVDLGTVEVSGVFVVIGIGVSKIGVSKIGVSKIGVSKIGDVGAAVTATVSFAAGAAVFAAATAVIVVTGIAGHLGPNFGGANAACPLPVGVVGADQLAQLRAGMRAELVGRAVEPGRPDVTIEANHVGLVPVHLQVREC